MEVPVARAILLLALLAWLPLPAEAVRELAVEYEGSEGGMPARLYLPEGAGRRPGVLVLHTILGPDPPVEAFARRLAGEGFVALTPDLFSLHEFGADGRVDHPLVLGDLVGALGFLKGRPEVDPERIAAVGFSFGGRLAVLAAALHPELRAAVNYYGVASYREIAALREVPPRALRSVPLTDRVSPIRAAVLIHHGEADRTVPAEQGRLLHRALVAAGKRSLLFLYPGADHRFDAPGSQHDPEAARLAWERTVAFLREHLR
jgi:carboxymethylenebutenolidase